MRFFIGCFLNLVTLFVAVYVFFGNTSRKPTLANVTEIKTQKNKTNQPVEIPQDLRKVKICLLTSCNTEERIAQNIYIHNSNRNYKKINYKIANSAPTKVSRGISKTLKSYGGI